MGLHKTNMAALARVSRKLQPFLTNRGAVCLAATRNAAYWNKDWKPGPYPNTPAEREAAAKKYGLRPEDYEPYPDDGMGYGDYPRLPRVASDSRDPYEDYDFPNLKRNYNEPLPVDYDIITEDKWNPTSRQRISTSYMLGWLGTVLFVTIGSYYLTLDYPHFHPVKPKQYPFKGETHYAFEKPE